MRFIVCLLTGLVLLSCRTTEEKDKRFFAGSKSSNDGIAGVNVLEKPEPKASEPLPSLIPKAPDPVEKGAFYRLCKAKDQFTSAEALTITAMLAAMHQQKCEDAENWLRDQRNVSLMIESEKLVELQTLTVLQNYPHIQNVYIVLAKGVNPVCPLALPQHCHFTTPEF